MIEHQISLYLDAPLPLYVKEAEGQYKLATDSQVLSQARVSINSILVKNQSCNNPEVVAEFLIGKIAGLGHEVLACLFLDTQLNLIEYKELFNGTISGASCYPREIAKIALALNASAVILSHNHPSGLPEPSRADIAVTRQVKKALELLDVRLIDHVVVGGNRTTSIASICSL